MQRVICSVLFALLQLHDLMKAGLLCIKTFAKNSYYHHHHYYSYEKVKTFKYLGSLVTNKNSIQEEIKCRLRAGFHVIIQSEHFCQLDFSSRIMLYACEAWSITLRKERRIRVFGNKILRRIFGPKRNANGKWIHNEELHCLYLSPNIDRVTKS